MLPESGSATPCGEAGEAAYGNDCPLWRVRTASGSFCARNAFHTCSPTVAPYLFCAASFTSADCTSPPPPAPNRPPTTEAIATMSVDLNGWMSFQFVTESACPVSTYSPGKFRAEIDCVMYALIPEM